MKMNHNKFNLKVGDLVTLDATYRNTSEVYIHSFTPNEMYALVYSKEEEPKTVWQTMTNRLTPIKEINFKNFYKFPLRKEERYRNVYTADNKLAFQFPHTKETLGRACKLFDDNTQEIIVQLINETLSISLLPFYTKIKQEGSFLIVDDEVIIIIRGWGMLTGQGVYKLPIQEALKIQDAFGAYIINSLVKTT
jgi:hypothetical protein